LRFLASIKILPRILDTSKYRFDFHAQFSGFPSNLIADYNHPLEEILMLNDLQKYRFACTLTFGDIYGQIIVWLIVIFLGLATSMAMYQNPVNALLAGGLILVLSLPFLLFAFVTTLLNHIEMTPISATASNAANNATPNRGISEVATAL
jgi:hypothetical protein